MGFPTRDTGAERTRQRSTGPVERGYVVSSTASEPADPYPERLAGSGRRQTRIAPPSLDSNQLPTPVVECGCGECCDALVDPLAEGEARVYAADECPEPRPMTVERAAEAYVRYQRSAWNASGRTSTYERACDTYGRLLEVDRQLQRRYGDGLTTVMLTRRLSPLDQSGAWLEPVALDARLHDSGATRAVMRALRYHLDGFDFEYVGVTAATESAATPHEHLLLWVDDADDAVTVDHLAPALQKHVEKVPGAYQDDHQYRPDGSGGAITVRHDPPTVDHCPERVSDILEESDAVEIGEGAESIDSRSVPANTAAAQYLASQLPHLVLGDLYDGDHEVSDATIDGGAIAWASPHHWLQSSSGIDL